MKKNFKFLFNTLLIIIIITSCSKENIESSLIQNDEFELNEQNKLLVSTSKVSSDFSNMGVTEINVKKNSNSTSYSFKNEKLFILNGEIINLSDYEVILEKNSLYLNNDNGFKMTIKDNKPYVISDSYKGFPKKSLYMLKKFNLLLFIMREIVMEESYKTDAGGSGPNSGSGSSGGCSFWDTWYVYGTGLTLSIAEANLASEIQNYSATFSTANGCTPIGSSNSGCYWEEYGCVASQAYCCNW